MGLWNEEMEQERNMLTEKVPLFYHNTVQLCKSYLGSYTNATLFETNDNFKAFGLIIKELGCCKVNVVEHTNWGRHVFIGTIITDAPAESAEVRALTCSSVLS
ncbi:unnamed protein product [Gongylonema pulchrum]|uniref:Guanylate cyclase domain-containing protein n=1 Tax=Gongylonema pulchrum TaxID=637853 RepID=A0A183CXI3_9BILA|nr:unnamed protein product [Gongylonema pulchrum]